MRNDTLYELHLETLDGVCKKYGMADWFECLYYLIQSGRTTDALTMVDSLGFVHAFEHDYLNEI